MLENTGFWSFNRFMAGTTSDLPEFSAIGTK